MPSAAVSLLRSHLCLLRNRFGGYISVFASHSKSLSRGHEDVFDSVFRMEFLGLWLRRSDRSTRLLGKDEGKGAAKFCFCLSVVSFREREREEALRWA